MVTTEREGPEQDTKSPDKTTGKVRSLLWDIMIAFFMLVGALLIGYLWHIFSRGLV